MHRIILGLFLFFISNLTIAQELTQNIRGQVIDIASQEALPFANIVILGSDPIIGTTSDIDGYYILENIPIGRYDLEVSYLGYETVILPEIVITTAKETVLKITMREYSNTLNEVVIRPKTLKENPLNQMATVSARMLSTEEANRYAGGFDDPARLASSFAGVSSSVANNAIIVRGNAPKFLQWKIEGVEIPNPNHFADLAVLGGGGLTALSSNLLANSDFYTGAFPAEYSNALSGVFDIKMRSGNRSNYEHSIELGAIGVDFASEGPLGGLDNSSYLINYRYSTLGLISSLLPEEAQGTNYQDLSFKFKVGTKKIGMFSLWGLGLIDNSGTIPKKELELRHYYQDIEEQDVKQYMGTVGLNHRLVLNDKSSLNTTLAFTSNGIDLTTDRLDWTEELRPYNSIDNVNSNLNLNSFINTKVSARHTNRSGFTARFIKYDYNLNEDENASGELINLVSEDGNSSLLSAYSSSSFNLNNWTINAGINSQFFNLNNQFTIEPRMGVAYQISKDHKLSWGYGLHSRIEALNVYLAKTVNSANIQANRDLDFTKAHHFILAYDWNLTDKIHLKVEPYYQLLFDVPIIENSTTSQLNLLNDWFLNDTYVNKGKGRNYGLDLTLEQFINKGFYYLISGSIFQSQYKTDQPDWYNTRFNKNYLFNFLVGKEFRLGKKQSLLGINLRMSTQGGTRYSPIDDAASTIKQDVVFDESSPFSLQADPGFIFHFTINYEWYRSNVSHKISLKVLNATNQKEFQGFRYNLTTNGVEEFREALIIPNISYKISF
jgi:hypothetical protein